MYKSKQEALFFQPIEKQISHYCPSFAQRDPSTLPNSTLLNKNFKQKNVNGKPLCFIQQDEQLLFPELGYEHRIYEKGLIATRNNNWHDFFNAMIWHAFPKTKTALNAIHMQEIENQISSVRSRKRDLLTLFDECGVVIIANDLILNLIKEHNWQELFVEHKQKWLDGDIKIITFGHAMFEKYLSPYIGMTAQALLLKNEPINMDSFLSEQFINNSLLKTKKELSPLPLLGIPDWSDNQTANFYANKNYFR